MRLFTIAWVVALAGCAGTLDAMSAGPLWATEPGERSSETEALSHYMASLIYQRTGEDEKAIDELRAAADLSTDSAWLQERLLSAYYQLEDYENAAVMGERALRHDPDSIVLRVWLGQIYFRLEDFDHAIEKFEDAIELDPDRSIGYEALAEVEEETHDLVGTLEVYERLLDLRPDTAFLHYRMGLNLARINDSKRARDELIKAVELDPEMTSARYLLGVVYQDLDEHGEAIKTFQRFLLSNEGHVSARLNIAGSYAQQRDYGRALEVLDQLIESDASDAGHYLSRMYLWLRSGRIEDPSLAQAPSDAPLIGTIIEAMIRKAVNEPYAALLSGLDDMDSDIDAEISAYFFNLLSLYGQEDTATFLEEQLAALRSGGAASHTLDMFHARVFMAMERYEDATKTLHGMIRDYGAQASYHYQMASAYEELKERGQVEHHLRRCLEFEPNDPDILNFLGYVLAEENIKLDEAQELLERALAIDPGNGFYLDSLGWIHYRKGDANKAVDLIRRAIRSDDMANDDAVLRDHLGDAYFLNGQLPEAIAEWRRALRLDPEFEGLEKKLRRRMRQLNEDS